MSKSKSQWLSSGLVCATTILFALAVCGLQSTKPDSSRILKTSHTRRGVLVPEATSPPAGGWNVADVFDEIDQRFGELAEGSAVFNVPPGMTVGQSERVVARLARFGEDRDILKSLPPGIAMQWRQAHITPSMKARLSGVDFDIKSGSSEEQLVGGGDHTQWEWSVTPNVSGEKELTLHIIAVVSVAGYEKPRDVLLSTRKVRVKVNPKLWLRQFAEAHFDKALYVALGALGLGVWRRIGAAVERRRNSKHTAGF